MTEPQNTNEAAGGGSALTAELGDWIDVIDRLPESGKPVLAACGKKVIRAAYAGKFALDEESWGYFNEGSEGSDYNEANDTAYWPEGWYEWNEWEETHWALDVEPEYWMPLPKVPNAEIPGRVMAQNEADGA